MTASIVRCASASVSLPRRCRRTLPVMAILRQRPFRSWSTRCVVMVGCGRTSSFVSWRSGPVSTGVRPFCASERPLHPTVADGTAEVQVWSRGAGTPIAGAAHAPAANLILFAAPGAPPFGARSGNPSEEAYELRIPTRLPLARGGRPRRQRTGAVHHAHLWPPAGRGARLHGDRGLPFHQRPGAAHRPS